MQRRHFLQFAAMLAGGAMLGRSGLACTTVAKAEQAFTLYSASNNAQGLHQLSQWQHGKEQHVTLPFRAHDVLTIANSAQLIAFGRRPDTQCAKVNINTGSTQLIPAAQGRHFYGHGCLSADQSILFTTENDYEKARGVIGVRDLTTLQIVAEIPSFGVGPHDIHLMPDGKTLVVANGGIQTHPDFGRRKLNLDSMQPSLVYIDIASGKKQDEYRLPDPTLSIRHLVLSEQGDVGVATQFQGNLYQQQPDSLVAWQAKGGDLTAIPMPNSAIRAVRGYMADVALDTQHRTLAVTAPRGNQVTFWDTQNICIKSTLSLPQPSGIQYLEAQQQFIISSATGDLFSVGHQSDYRQATTLFSNPALHWDNHLIIL